MITDVKRERVAMTKEEAITVMQLYKDELEHRIAKIDYDIREIDLYSIHLDAFEVAIEALSAEAVQGEWGHMIADGTDGSHWYEYECSHCGEVVLRPYNFCPNCGAKMYEDGDDTTGESL